MKHKLYAIFDGVKLVAYTHSWARAKRLELVGYAMLEAI